MIFTETRQKFYITPIQHEHYYRLTLKGGAVVAVCECGNTLTAKEIENFLNSKG